MRKELIIILTALSFASYIPAAYAILDVPAGIQTQLELGKKVLTTVKEGQKMANDVQKGITQGIGMVQNCLANPMQCNIGGLFNLAKFGKGRIKKFNTITGQAGDLFKKEQEGADLEKGVRETEYQKGGERDIENVNANRKKNNAVTTADIELLYAKGAVVRQEIYLEQPEEIYAKESELESINKIIVAKSNMELITNYRLSRILELRAYMNSGRGVAGLTHHTRSMNDGDEE